MRCPNCLSPLPQGADRCPDCGAPIGQTAPAAPAPRPAGTRKASGLRGGAAAAWLLVILLLAGNFSLPYSFGGSLRRALGTGGGVSANGGAVAVPDRRQEKDSILGSAGYLRDDVVLVSIYVDDADSAWDEGKQDKARSCIAVACEYLEEQAAHYGQELRLYYDVTEHPELAYRMEYERDAAADDTNFDMRLWKWIEQNVPVGGLQEVYGTDNIGFLALVAKEGGAYTNVFYVEDPKNYYNEISVLYYYYPYVRVNDREVPAVYAHEILHQFGAIDLYEGSGDFSPENCAYVAEHYPDDIMYSAYDDDGRLRYDEIRLEVGPVTAYYLGWLDELPEEDRAGMKDYERSYVAGFSYDDLWYDEEDWGDDYAA